MYNKWKNTSYLLHALAEKYEANRQEPPKQIHQEILSRAMKLLSDIPHRALQMYAPASPGTNNMIP